MSGKKGKLFVISAPSGAGKTTLVHRMLKQFKELSYSVSSTTRSPRGNEKDGKDYFFISIDDFKTQIDNGTWLEWAKVHGNYYGTAKAPVLSHIEKGGHMIMDIDVQGADQIIGSDLDPVTIFILPPSAEILAARLSGRGTDTEDVIRKRLDTANSEMARKDRFKYNVINDDLERAVSELAEIFIQEMA